MRQNFGDHEELLFTRGFLLWRGTEPSPQIIQRLGWETRHVDQWRFANADNLEVAVHEGSTSVVVLAGWASSLEAGSTDLDTISSWLSQSASEDAEFQRKIDSLVGRFVVLRIWDEQVRVQQDGLGMRSVYYSDLSSPPLVGSHAHLVGEAMGATPSAWAEEDFAKRTNLRSLPGRRTTRNGVLAHLPNTELHLTTRRITRIFPTRQRAETPLLHVMPAVRDRVRVSIWSSEGHRILAFGAPHHRWFPGRTAGSQGRDGGEPLPGALSASCTRL